MPSPCRGVGIQGLRWEPRAAGRAASGAARFCGAQRLCASGLVEFANAAAARDQAVETTSLAVWESCATAHRGGDASRESVDRHRSSARLFFLVLLWLLHARQRVDVLRRSKGVGLLASERLERRASGVQAA